MRLPRRAQPAPGVPIDALLREVDALRLTIDADLTVAAAAVEAHRPDLASDVIEADRIELQLFARWADKHMASAARGEQGPPRREPGRPTRKWLLFPAVPALAAAAAAVIAVTGGVVEAPERERSVASSDMAPVAASWAELAEVARSDAGSQRLIAAGDRLHDQLEALIARAGSDPVALRQALRILQAEQQLLGRNRQPGASTVLARASALVARLHAALPPALRPDPGQREAAGEDDADVLPLPLPLPEPSEGTTGDEDGNSDRGDSGTAQETSAPQEENTPATDPDVDEPDPDTSIEPTPPVEDPWPFGDLDFE